MSGPRVVIVDDEGLLRTLVVRALERDTHVTIVGEAADGERCIEVVRTTRPDVVVLDLGIPGLAGAPLVDEIRRAAPGVRVVVYSARGPDEGPPTGADHHVLKDGDLSHLVDVVAAVVPGDGVPRQASLALPVAARSPSDARRWVAARCEEWGCSEALHAASLIVSELVTNAVTHAASSCELRLLLSALTLRIEVQDGSTAVPKPAPGDVDAEGGRGLLLIDAVSDAWGVDPIEGGKCVWAEVVRR